MAENTRLKDLQAEMKKMNEYIEESRDRFQNVDLRLDQMDALLQTVAKSLDQMNQRFEQLLIASTRVPSQLQSPAKRDPKPKERAGSREQWPSPNIAAIERTTQVQESNPVESETCSSFQSGSKHADLENSMVGDGGSGEVSEKFDNLSIVNTMKALRPERPLVDKEILITVKSFEVKTPLVVEPLNLPTGMRVLLSDMIQQGAINYDIGVLVLNSVIKDLQNSALFKYFLDGVFNAFSYAIFYDSVELHEIWEIVFHNSTNFWRLIPGLQIILVFDPGPNTYYLWPHSTINDVRTVYCGSNTLDLSWVENGLLLVLLIILVQELGQKNEDNVLVFLHGFIGTGDDCIAIMEAMSGSAKCISVDIPGQRKSIISTVKIGKQGSCLYMEMIAGLLHNLIHHITPEKVTLLGYSMGARIALYMALKFDFRVKGTVLISGSPGLNDKLARKICAAKVIASRVQQHVVQGLVKVLSDLNIGRQPSLWEDLKNCRMRLVLMYTVSCNDSKDLKLLCNSNNSIVAIHQVNDIDCTFEISSLVNLLEVCQEWGLLQEAKSIHGYVLKLNSTDQDCLVLLNHIMHVYSNCLDYDAARKVFDGTSQRNVFSWKIMMVALNEQGYYSDGIVLFSMMLDQEVLPDGCVFSAVLQPCVVFGFIEFIEMAHAQVVIRGFLIHIVVSTSLLNSYAKLGKIESSSKVFNTMVELNIASWNAMISGYTSNGLHAKAFDCFNNMVQSGTIPNNTLLFSVSKAVGQLEDVNKCHEIYRFASQWGLDSNTVVGTALIDMSAKCGTLTDARFILDSKFSFSQANTPWNALLTGYLQSGSHHEALELFTRMCQNNISSDVYTFCSVFNSIAALNHLKFLRETHALAWKHEHCVMKISTLNSLTDTYGPINDNAQFSNMDLEDKVHFNGGSNVTIPREMGLESDPIESPNQEHKEQADINNH